MDYEQTPEHALPAHLYTWATSGAATAPYTDGNARGAARMVPTSADRASLDSPHCVVQADGGIAAILSEPHDEHPMPNALVLDGRTHGSVCGGGHTASGLAR